MKAKCKWWITAKTCQQNRVCVSSFGNTGGTEHLCSICCILSAFSCFLCFCVGQIEAVVHSAFLTLLTARLLHEVFPDQLTVRPSWSPKNLPGVWTPYTNASHVFLPIVWGACEHAEWVFLTSSLVRALARRAHPGQQNSQARSVVYHHRHLSNFWKIQLPSPTAKLDRRNL